MRSLRMLASLVLAAMLTALPALTLAQSGGSSPSMPLALRPDGRLPLQGTPWRLEAYRYRGTERTPGPEVAAQLRLRPGTLDASGGCTRFGGRFGTVGSTIGFELRGLKDNACGEQTVLVQMAMVDGLRKAASYTITPGDEPGADQLVLHSATGVELLRFGLDDIGGLDLGEWRLESYTVEGTVTAAHPSQPAVLAFRPTRQNGARRVASGSATGSTGCNGIVGDFHRHANVMSFGDFDRTEAPCSPALAAQEEAMMAVLDATSQSVSLPPDRLVLIAHDSGDRLDFVSSRPLEGSTWLLSKLPDAPEVDGAVTLRLSDGRASGEGSCGAYSASYATDGLFISFADLAGSDDEACADIEAEQALLAALRDTVMLDREQPQLRLLDARGTVVARFAPPAGP